MIFRNVVLMSALGILAGCVSTPPVREILRYEAEDYTTPKEAWQINTFSEDHWNLWSTDKNADKKWSGGVVLQSPAVKEDRKSGEEGAPVLHTVIEGVPKGIYDIYINSTRSIGVSLDGKTWSSSTGGVLFDDPVRIRNGRFELWVDDRFANVGGTGPCYYDYLELRPATGFRPAKYGERVPSPADFAPVEGWASHRVEEVLDRGVVAQKIPGGAYVGWRLLKTDPQDVAFDVFRRIGNGQPEKLNAGPVSQTTDFVDSTLPDGDEAVTYMVCPMGTTDTRGAEACLSSLGSEPSLAAYQSIKLKEDTTRFQKIAFADLNGDGALDYVIKHPHGNVDPCASYWVPSPETCKLEAYLNDGTWLWTRDLGWSIERGIWYSPYVVADLNGDGKAEIAVKTGEGDPRDEDGRVCTGREWLSIWDGMTGKQITKTPWPSREGFLGLSSDYNYYCRNQLAVAYLDGKTPCVIALRGTYNLMKVDAYQLKGKRLKSLWSYSNEGLAREYWGQGEHFTHAVDVDGDGRDEVMLGNVMLDDTGCPLWTTGLGHDDAGYVTDVLPNRPGLEIYYIIETRQPRNGMCVVDARTGEIIWGYDKPTRHVHSAGMCADIDPLHPGMEGWGADSEEHKISAGPWLWSADGQILAFEDPTLPKRFDISTAFWDADLQKECLFGSPCDFRGGPVDGKFEGSVAMVADIAGDWREEVITSVPGELRIYTTTIPAMDRRVCLMQDPIYRADVRMDSMGYRKLPSLSYCPSGTSPNINFTVLSGDKKGACRVVVSAPVDRAVKGEVTLAAGEYAITPATFSVDLAPGELKVVETALDPAAFTAVTKAVTIEAALATADGRITTRVPAFIPRPPLRKYTTTLPRVEAEEFSGEGGGKVKVRTDKTNVSGKAISHWDSKDHWLEWTLEIPASGASELVFRYSTPAAVTRDTTLDGQSMAPVQFPATGGFGDHDKDWREYAVKVSLSPGKHVLRLANADGQGLNLDFIGYR